MNFAQLVLDRKLNEAQEYSLQLFEKCNLTCSFCWQDHNVRTGMDTIREKSDIFKTMIQTEPLQHIRLNIMGGELFADDIFDDKLYSDYLYLAVECNKHAKEFGKDVVISWGTNLVYENTDRVIRLVEELQSLGVKSCLATSYDSHGRFNKAQLEVFKRNVEILRPYLDSVSMLFTRPVIKTIMNGTDEYFKYLYNEGFKIYFDYYDPTLNGTEVLPSIGIPVLKNHESIGPSDLEMLRMFEFLVDNYPKVAPISLWIGRSTNTITCRSSKCILEDGSTSMCGVHDMKDTKLVHFYKSRAEKSGTPDIQIADSYMEQWGCMTCEYFERCTLGCFVQHAFKHRKRMVQCPYKMIYDKITKNVPIDYDSIEQRTGTS